MTRTLTTVPESACTVLTLAGGARTVSTTDTKWTAADWLTLTTCDPADIDTDNPDLWDDEAAEEITICVTAHIYTEAEIAAAVELYADFYGIGADEVDVTRAFRGDDVIGFRLSRDADGAQRGDDERHGEF